MHRPNLQNDDLPDQMLEDWSNVIDDRKSTDWEQHKGGPEDHDIDAWQQQLIDRCQWEDTELHEMGGVDV